MGVKFNLSTKEQAGGIYTLRIDITHNGQRIRKGVGIEIKPSHWDESRRRVKVSHPRHAQYNAKIDQLKDRAELTMLEHPEFTALQIWEACRRGGGDMMIDAISVVAKEHPGFSDATKVILSTTIARAKAVIPEVRMGALAPDHVAKFRRALEGDKLAPNTVRKYLRMLRLLYNLSADLRGMDRTRAFARLMPAEVQALPRSLSADQVRAIALLELEGAEALARDTWMLSLYLGGIRSGDLLRLKRTDIHDNGVLYRATKTARPRWIPLIAPSRAILDRYPGEHLLPWADKGKIHSANAQVNKLLKVVAARAGIKEKVSMHWARHACTQYLLTLGVPLDVVQMILGHAKIQQTIDYANRFDRQRVIEAMEKVGKAIG